MKKISALAFLLMLPAAWAASIPSSYRNVCVADSFNAEALAWISTAFMLVSIAIALAYMYSKARQDAAVSVWAHDEAMNLLISVVLLVGLIGAFAISCEVASGMADPAGGDPFKLSQNYLKTLLNARGLNVLRSLTSSSIHNQMDATAYLYLGLTPIYGSGVAGRANLRAHSAQKEFLVDFYLPLVASLTAQMYILQGIQWVGATVLLPFSFLLRLFPFSRDFGNMLLALFFGLYIVVPTLYSLSGRVYMEQMLNRPIECVNCGINMFRTFALDAPLAPLQNTVLYSIGSTIPQAVFLPNLVIAVAVSCIMAISKALRAIAV